LALGFLRSKQIILAMEFFMGWIYKFTKIGNLILFKILEALG
jgi:hypothetical protein